MPTLTDTCLYHEMAGLLDYPIHGVTDQAESVRKRLSGDCPEAAEAVEAFAAELHALSPEEREELYVRTFDFAPLCAPYVGSHLSDGNGEGFKRSALMAALAGVYRQAGFHPEGELPDHLAVILRFRSHLAADEWTDMARCCLLPATWRMLDELERVGSPYRHLLRAIRSVLSSEFPEEAIHA